MNFFNIIVCCGLCKQYFFFKKNLKFFLVFLFFFTRHNSFPNRFKRSSSFSFSCWFNLTNFLNYHNKTNRLNHKNIDFRRNTSYFDLIHISRTSSVVPTVALNQNSGTSGVIKKINLILFIIIIFVLKHTKFKNIIYISFKPFFNRIGTLM